jgi:hypothetical protein
MTRTGTPPLAEIIAAKDAKASSGRKARIQAAEHFQRVYRT